ncbi:MAG: hypothetical protein JXA87_14090 [Thermoleophilia bacterium]|nr:hypothetical protein [Thermoleophilia bacterium]
MESILQRDLTVAVPPNISVQGQPTEAGSHALAGYTALEDATVVRRLRDAGAHLRDSTPIGEFGLGLPCGQTGAAPRRTAAGDADAPIDVELVMDFMGESRLAAARASMCGLKPSYGLVSRLGLVGLIPSMECCGMIGRNPGVLREVLAAVAGQDDLDFSLPDEVTPDFSLQTIDPPKTTIGVIIEAQRSPEAGEAGEVEAFRSGVEELKRLGFSLREVSLPDYPLFSLVHRIIGSVEASSAAGRYDSVRYGPRAPGAKNWNEMYLLSRGAAFGTVVKSYLIQGAFFQFERYGAFVDACRIRARLVQDMRRLTSEVDFFVLPVSGGAAALAPSAGEASSSTSESLTHLYAEFASTLFANVTGQPALYLPPAPGSGLLGFQLAGPWLSDGRLLSSAEFILDSRGGE